MEKAITFSGKWIQNGSFGEKCIIFLSSLYYERNDIVYLLYKHFHSNSTRCLLMSHHTRVKLGEGGIEDPNNLKMFKAHNFKRPLQNSLAAG
jgi:hypothetical protein